MTSEELKSIENKISDQHKLEQQLSNDYITKEREKYAKRVYNESKPNENMNKTENTENDKCPFIINNVLLISWKSIASNSQTYIREFFETTRCTKSMENHKSLNMNGVNNLHRCRAQYLKKIPEDTMMKVLTSQPLLDEEKQLVRDTAHHYYFWNKTELKKALKKLDKVKYYTHVLQDPWNTTAILAAVTLFGGIKGIKYLIKRYKKI